MTWIVQSLRRKRLSPTVVTRGWAKEAGPFATKEEAEAFKDLIKDPVTGSGILDYRVIETPKETP